MHITEDTVVTIAERADSDREHRIFAVTIETPFTIEMQRCPTFIYPGDPDHPGGDVGMVEASYRSWGVWDARVADWARVSAGWQDASHFGSRGEAEAWLRDNLADLLAYKH